MGKRLEQTIQTQENLKTAFWDIYHQKPLDQITVREITDLAGYNRGTFYVYFKDVPDILEQSEEEILSIFEMEDSFVFNPRDRKNFGVTISFFVEFIEGHHRQLMLLAGERGDPKFMQRLRAKVERLVANRLRPFSPLEDCIFKYTVAALISAEATLVMIWFERGKDIPFERLVDLLYDLLFEGPLDILVGKNPSTR